MNDYEKLQQEASDKGLEVMEWDFKSSRIEGLYCDGTIAVSSSLPTSAAKACVLAEEIAHHDISVGDILVQRQPDNQRQEYQARMLAYSRFASPKQLVNALKAGYRSLDTIAEYMGVTEEFLTSAIQCYRNKYGLCTTVDGCILLLDPAVGILNQIEPDDSGSSLSI